ncbi:MAG: winged helix-turn-helix domain-containing protein [Hyphomicrobiaceae bacterium]|nr:winged helix-turn-helix domain-containing protein [Hyphomicrobiaceae bacterium]
MNIAETAELAGASLTSIKRWKRALKMGGVAALATKRHPGPKPKLSPGQKQQLVEILVQGPEAAGYANGLWTCARVAEVIEERFGVSYHPDHVGRILHRLGFSPQKPQRRAQEADVAAIRHWRQVSWPRIKKGGGESKPASFSSTNADFNCSR